MCSVCWFWGISRSDWGFVPVCVVYLRWGGVCKVSFCFIGSAAVNIKVPLPVRCVDKPFLFFFFSIFRRGWAPIPGSGAQGKGWVLPEATFWDFHIIWAPVAPWWQTQHDTRAWKNFHSSFRARCSQKRLTQRWQPQRWWEPLKDLLSKVPSPSLFFKFCCFYIIHQKTSLPWVHLCQLWRQKK